MPPRIVVAAALSLAALAPSGVAQAAGEAAPLLSNNWSHEGLFGTFDRAAAQRGFQVYREVCSGCHGIEYIAFRNLMDLGFSGDEVVALAAEYTVEDGPDDLGDMFDRPARPVDGYPSPFPNDQAARASNGGALPPDLSLITKARPDGTNYLYSLLLGYVEPPAEAAEGAPEGMYYNAYFGGNWIAMPPALDEGLIEYADGTAATVEQMSADVTTFLSWAAEPKLEERKQTGLKVTLFLIILTALCYATMRKVWADAH